jgi:fatty-acyl-CoA synthase
MEVTVAEISTIPEALRRAASSEHGITLVDGGLDEVAVVDYGELEARASRAAVALAERGVEQGDRVCLLSSTSADFLSGLFGVWGAAATPVVLALPRRRSDLPRYVEDLTWRLAHTDARALLVADQFAPLLEGLESPTPVVRLGDLAAGDGAPARRSRSDDLAVLQFTSGSTGRSRAVMLSHANVLANIEALSEAAAVDGDRDVIVSWLPLFHDMGLVLTLAAVWNRLPLVLETPEEFLAAPGSWMGAVSRFGGTITVAPNFAYGLATRALERGEARLDLSSLRLAGNGAEPIDLNVLERFLAFAEPHGFRRDALAPMYGLAEATVGVTITHPGRRVRDFWVSRSTLETAREARPARPLEPDARRLVSSGQALPGIEVIVTDDAGRPLGEREVGELCVRGANVTRGYWRDPEATEAIFRDGWLLTGDLGFVDGDDVVISGRKKDMIIVGGRNLYPEDYEQSAIELPQVRRGNVIAFGVPERERMVVVAEANVSDGEGSAVAEQLMTLLRERLSHAPEEVVVVPPRSLPKTSSGKLQRGLCRERYREGGLPAVATVSR